MNIDLSPIITAAERANPPAPGDYPSDGLLYCGRCHTPKQMQLEFCGQITIVPCTCQCATRTYALEQKKKTERERMAYIEQLPIQGIQDRSISGCTFASAATSTELDKLEKYATNWIPALEKNLGLLLWGGPGNGKTFGMACIVNELKKQGVPVLMTSFPRILSAVTGLFQEERTTYLDSLGHFDFLAIDDMGVERSSDFAREIVYYVIDARYKCHKPLIITTNLTLDKLKNPPNMDYGRIYDRVFEMCQPIYFNGESKRPAKATAKLAILQKLLSDEKVITAQRQ